MRFASAPPEGRPDVATVLFSMDGDDIVTAGFDIANFDFAPAAANS